MDPTIPSRTLLISQKFKPTKKDPLFPYFQKVSHLHDNKEQNPPKLQPRNPAPKALSRVNSPKLDKSTHQSKLQRRERSISKAVNAYMKDLREEYHGLGPRARSLVKSSARSCLPSPTVKREDITMFHHQPVRDFDEKKRSFFIPNVELKPEVRPPSREPAKKRVKIIRVEGNQRPSVLAPESNLDYQMFIANPAIEQELFKEYLGTDRQTFGFEKQVISGTYEQTPSHFDFTTINSKSTVDTNASVKHNKMETKLQVLTRDSSNTIAGLTTNNTSRCKGSLGLLSGFSEKENVDLIELIDWSLEIQNDDNKEKAKLPVQKHVKNMSEHRRKDSISNVSNVSSQAQTVRKHVKPPPTSVLKMSSSRVNKGILKLYRDSSKRDVSL